MPARPNDLADWRVFELMPVLSAAKKERTTRQLADVQHISREQEALADRLHRR